MQKRILVVDDHFSARKVLADIFPREISVCHAGDGAEAIQMFCHAVQEDEPYHAIFLDITMPKMDGLTALRIIREKEKAFGMGETPVIMVTALQTPKAVFQAYYRLGANDYIPKPFTRERVWKALKEYVIGS